MDREPAGEKTPAAHGSASTPERFGVAAMRRFPRKARPESFSGAGTNPHVRDTETKIARARKEIGLSPECREALDRLTALAHGLSATLTGDALSPDGTADTPRAQALVMAMLCFLLRANPEDLQAALFAEGSLKTFAYAPGQPAPMRRPPLSALLE